MSITFQTQIENDILIIQASGKDDSVEDVIEYGIAIIQLGLETGVSHILCDERALEYTIDTFDIFTAAKQIADAAPKIARVAIVCQPKFLQDGKFWETVAVNRGLNVRLDSDYDRAWAWLTANTT